MAIRGILFDKDGTLFGFQQTWGPWAVALAENLSGGDPSRRDALCDAMALDPGTARFRPESPVIAGTVAEQTGLLLPLLPGWTAPELEAFLLAEAARAVPVPAADLPALMTALRDRGLALGVATNDGEGPARRHLRDAGIEDRFDWIAGYDSGWGAKPGPGQIAGFLAHAALAPAELLMVGDTMHDLDAARAAGTLALAVLTGVADAAALAAHAAAVLDDVGAIPAWLDARGA